MRKPASAGRSIASLGTVALSAYLLLHLTFHVRRAYNVQQPLVGVPWSLNSTRSTLLVDDSHRLIPRTIHQTYKTRHVSKEHWRAIKSWKVNNPGWEYKFYDDLACEEFVANEYPHWLDAYRSLPLAVEQADFFRYLVVLRHGGLYADVDTECGRPLDELITAHDSLVVGWEDEYPTPQLAVQYKFARQRQLEQWTFAAEPGHPALQAVCERVVANAYLPYNGSNTDALFRTGPGPFTDEILTYAMEHEQRGSHSVRILPRVTLGGLPGGGNGMSTWQEPARIVAHHHMGSWKSRSFRHKAFLLVDETSARTLLQAPSKAELEQKLYPVSVASQPQFTVMTYMKGHNMVSCGMASQITTWGHPLAPGAFIMQRPIYQEFLALWQERHNAGEVLLDVGAGMGFYTTAAAAAGRKVEAMEAGHWSLVTLQASVAYNGFAREVNVQQPSSGLQKALESGKGLRNVTRRCAEPPVLSSRAALGLLNDRLPHLSNTSLGAVRISVPGFESYAVAVLQEKLMAPSLRVVLLEAYPQLSHCAGTNDTTLQTIAELQQAGFNQVVHMGNICMRMKTQGLWRQDLLTSIVIQISSRARRALEQTIAADPGLTWCDFEAQGFQAASRMLVRSHEPEVFLLSKTGAFDGQGVVPEDLQQITIPQ